MGKFFFCRLRSYQQAIAADCEIDSEFVGVYGQMILIPKDPIEAVARSACHLDRERFLARGMAKPGSYFDPHAVAQRDRRRTLRGASHATRHQCSEMLDANPANLSPHPSIMAYRRS